MSEFDDRIRVNLSRKSDATDKVEKSNRNPEFREKVAEVITTAIASIKTNSKSEEIEKIEYLLSLNRFMDNYDEHLRILQQHEKNHIKSDADEER